MQPPLRHPMAQSMWFYTFMKKSVKAKSALLLEHGTTPDQLGRIWIIHNALSRNEHLNYSSLKDYGYSRRTFLRDIEFMDFSLNLPIKFDHTRKTYYYTEAVTQFPTLSISPAEMNALATGQAVMAQYVGSALADKIQSALKKISRLIGINAFNAPTNSTIKVIGAIRDENHIFETLDQAILNRQPVAFVYRKTGQADSTKETRRVHPHHCAFNKGRWYLAAYDLEREAMRTFALTRIEKLKILKGKYERQAGFNPDEYFTGFGIIKGDGQYHIKMEFDQWGADLLKGSQWHSSQKTVGIGEGRILVTMDLQSLDEITNWLMSWGAHAKVITPLELQNKVKEAAKAVVDLYK